MTTLTAALTGSAAFAQGAAQPAKPAPAAAAKPAASAPFTLEDLPYAYEALEPVIDAETMRIHHDAHHKSYVDNLNKAVAANSALSGQSLEKILANVSRYDAVVRNNAGGHYNHTLFWKLMAPPGKTGTPSKALAEQINKDFKSLEEFKKAFAEAGTKRFGSGWAWLVWTGDKLQVGSTPNQDNPLMDASELKGTPVIANDVWEHAYYLKHRNKRDAYLAAWWEVLNWNEANRLFDEARAAKKK
jgi:superoxide dismutase, Fe-Mn family